mmetsp:Transcript_111982/g.289380  ORF Transcript_111982/g.289380 Transcript_111982/m.289380 type:complete len:265 (-) Transcript_111982:159-953(-)
MAGDLMPDCATLGVVEAEVAAVVGEAHNGINLLEVAQLLHRALMLGLVPNMARLVCFDAVNRELIATRHASLDQVIRNLLPSDDALPVNIHLSEEVDHRSSSARHPCWVLDLQPRATTVRVASSADLLVTGAEADPSHRRATGPDTSQLLGGGLGWGVGVRLQAPQHCLDKPLEIHRTAGSYEIGLDALQQVCRQGCDLLLINRGLLPLQPVSTPASSRTRGLASSRRRPLACSLPLLLRLLLQCGQEGVLGGRQIAPGNRNPE